MLACLLNETLIFNPKKTEVELGFFAVVEVLLSLEGADFDSMQRLMPVSDS